MGTRPDITLVYERIEGTLKERKILDDYTSPFSRITYQTKIPVEKGNVNMLDLAVLIEELDMNMITSGALETPEVWFATLCATKRWLKLAIGSSKKRKCEEQRSDLNSNPWRLGYKIVTRKLDDMTPCSFHCIK